MSDAKSNAKLRGVIAAVATPIDEGGAPDTERATELARYLVDNGCDGSTCWVPPARRPRSRAKSESA